ncbi:MAG: protein-arginine kinase [Pirellulaceae bacterium]|nr:MAG: protein-arginine kinase [Pirellulaceae bacterium]
MLQQLAGRCGPWLVGDGPESDIVVSTRIRLARNLAQFPFVRRCSPQDRAAIEKTIRDRFQNVEQLRQLIYIDVDELSDVDRQFLMERQLISRELAEGTGQRGVAIDPDERFSVMVNEEDHLRIQVMASGLNPQVAWEQINAIDDLIGQQVVYAFHRRLGYLTACPTNVGTGMRVSIMIHLPAMVMTEEIQRVFRSFQKMGLAVRGLYGEGTQPRGDFYQISNQITLGRSEKELIDQVVEVARVCIQWERRAREALVRSNDKSVQDAISRAYAILQTTHTISSEETMELLSRVRMGVSLGLIEDVPITVLNKLFIHTQPAHLQKIRGTRLDTSDRNVERASYLKEHLAKQR